ncbi:MAG: hypothetical protein RIT27_239 [Pseudomonadota bacterium]|jgi:hypothetical protein
MLRISGFIFLIGFSSTVLLAEEDPESYPWKQGLVQVFKRGIEACTTTKVLVEDYKTFAGYGTKASKFYYKDTYSQFEEKIEHFEVASKHYSRAEAKYKEALQLLAKAKSTYETGKSSATRAQDRDLALHRTLTNNQLKAASKIYKQALQVVLEGNREFNQATRFYNTGTEIFQMKTGELIAKRQKFHRWPPEKLQ